MCVSSVCSFSLSTSAKHQLLLNVTSSLMQLIRATHCSWSQDLFGSSDNGNGTGGSSPHLSKLHHRSSVKLSEMPRGLALLHSVGHLSQQSKRAEFIPYLLKNNTGLPLKFAKMTSLPNVVVMVGSSPSPGSSMYLNPMRSVSGSTSQSLLVTSLEETSEWQEVPPGGEIPFDFETIRNSIRQRVSVSSYIQCIPIDHCCSCACTVEPLYEGHHWDPAGCPVYSGTAL